MLHPNISQLLEYSVKLLDIIHILFYAGLVIVNISLSDQYVLMPKECCLMLFKGVSLVVCIVFSFFHVE